MEDSKILRTSTLVATNTANKLFSASIYNDRSSPEIFADKRNKGDGYTHGRINEMAQGGEFYLLRWWGSVVYITSSRRTVRLGSLLGLYEGFPIKK